MSLVQNGRRWAVLALLLVIFASRAAFAAMPENKVFVYVVYSGNSQNHRLFAQALLKKFNQLGFTEKMKKKGVSWVENSYGNLGAAASYLHIAPDDIIYVGILMADRSDRMTREMFRDHVAIPPNATPKVINSLADACAHEAYFALADVLDNLKDKSRWARQMSLLDWRDEKAGQVKIVLDGKDITNNKELLPKPAYKRQNIHLVMVPFSPALFKKLGADDAGTGTCSGGRELLWIKKGTMRLQFEVGPQLTDLKTYIVNYGPGGEKKFISPIKSLFAYPEPNGGTTFVPLNLVIKYLYLPFDVEDDGMTETITPKK